MIDWSDNTTEDDPPLGEQSDTPTVDWDTGDAQGGSSWADEPAVDEQAADFGQESYESPAAAAEPPTDESGRAAGTVKTWRAEKAFGFIARDDGGPDVFVHIKSVIGGKPLNVGDLVTYRFETGGKGASANDVVMESAAEVADVAQKSRETGTVASWNSEKGFGFIAHGGEKDLFAHKRDVASGNDLAVGQSVSFVMEDGPKGPSAKKIEEEEGTELALADESDRMYGKVKNYDDSKGFCFIGRCDGQGDVFGHKRNFQGGVEPVKGMGVSFVLETSEKGDNAMKIREEDEIPEMILSDVGREFGIIVKWIEDKGFGYIQRRTGGEEAHVHARACTEFTPTKGACVSFVFEENDKGPTAKDVREEDPERIARVTAVRRYGTVDFYADPPRDELNNGYGFVIPDGPQAYGAPRKYYFHMDSITTPDERGGLWPHDYVSFIVMPAKKGVHAIDVTLEDKSEIESIKVKEQHIEDKMSSMDFSNGSEVNAAISAGGKENEAPVVEESAWDLSSWGV